MTSVEGTENKKSISSDFTRSALKEEEGESNIPMINPAVTPMIK
jgi:hypothetical protein